MWATLPNVVLVVRRESSFVMTKLNTKVDPFFSWTNSARKLLMVWEIVTLNNPSVGEIVIDANMDLQWPHRLSLIPTSTSCNA